MIAQFPAAEHDVLVTREHLRAELLLIRAEMATKADVAELRAEMATKADLADLRAGMATKADLAELRTEIAELRTEVHALMNRAVFASIGAMGTMILGTGWILAFG